MNHTRKNHLCNSILVNPQIRSITHKNNYAYLSNLIIMIHQDNDTIISLSLHSKNQKYFTEKGVSQRKGVIEHTHYQRYYT